MLQKKVEDETGAFRGFSEVSRCKHTFVGVGTNKLSGHKWHIGEGKPSEVHVCAGWLCMLSGAWLAGRVPLSSTSNDGWCAGRML